MNSSTAISHCAPLSRNRQIAHPARSQGYTNHHHLNVHSFWLPSCTGRDTCISGCSVHWFLLVELFSSWLSFDFFLHVFNFCTFVSTHCRSKKIFQQTRTRSPGYRRHPAALNTSARNQICLHRVWGAYGGLLRVAPHFSAEPNPHQDLF